MKQKLTQITIWPLLFAVVAVAWTTSWDSASALSGVPPHPIDSLKGLRSFDILCFVTDSSEKNFPDIAGRASSRLQTRLKVAQIESAPVSLFDDRLLQPTGFLLLDIQVLKDQARKSVAYVVELSVKQGATLDRNPAQRVQVATWSTQEFKRVNGDLESVLLKAVDRAASDLTKAYAIANSP